MLADGSIGAANDQHPPHLQIVDLLDGNDLDSNASDNESLDSDHSDDFFDIGSDNCADSQSFV